MHFHPTDHPSTRKLTGIAIAAVVHVGIVYALLAGLGGQIVRHLTRETDVTIVPDRTSPLPPETTPEPQVRATDARRIIPDIAPPVLTDPAPTITLPGTTVDGPATDGGPQVGPTISGGSDARAVPVRTAAVVDFSSCARPDYPRNAARLGEQGTVMLQFLIGTNGRVLESRVAASSGSRELDRSAQQALAQCQFRPATLDGQPQQSWTSVQYVWKLE